MFVFDWLSGPFAESLFFTLLHSLWQGVVLGTLLLLVLRSIPHDRPRLRYAAALMCFYSVMIGACVTWSILRIPVNIADGQAISGAAVYNVTTSDATLPGTALDVSSQQDASTPSQAIPFNPTDAKPQSFYLSIAQLTPWMLSLWIIGAGGFLVRSSRDVVAARRLQLGTPIEDPNVLQLLKQLASKIALSRPIQLLSAEGLSGPCVLGVLKPIILIPTSLVTGLAPDQWEAILAHELAHIRRWDYLTNLSQLVIESLLFFNPTVWWISRQVRYEREACCDAYAVRLTSKAIQYATVLVDVAEHMRDSSRSLVQSTGFADERSGSLPQRVRRIVSPDSRSELKLGWPVGAILLAIGLIAIGLLQTGSDLAVAVAAEILSDDQRVEALVESAEKSGFPDSSEVDLSSKTKLTIRGTIVTEEDAPSQHPVQISRHTRRGNRSSSGPAASVDLNKSPEFSVSATPGITYLLFLHPDFAETYVGPFGARDGPVVEGLRIVLKRGVEIPVTVVDEKGVPVPGARISAVPRIGGGGSTYRKASITNETGQTVLKHLNLELNYGLSVKSPGFQKTELPPQKLSVETPLQIELNHARPVVGVILNQQNEPVSQAAVKIVRSRRSGMTNNNGRWGNAIAVSGEQGRFRLTELKDGTRNDLLIEADGYAPGIIPNVQPGDNESQIVLGPPIHISGTIHGSLKQLEDLPPSRAVSWQLQFPPQAGELAHDRVVIHDSVKCEIVDGVGKFTLPPMAPGTLKLKVGKAYVERELTKSIDNLAIHLSENAEKPSPDIPATRLIRISFTRGGKSVAPRGAIQISNRSPGSETHRQKSVPIRSGVVEMKVYPPGRLFIKCNGMIGFWFGSHDATTKVPAGDGIFEIQIPVRPAGAAKGMVRNADGTPADDASVSVQYKLVDHSDGYKSFSSGINTRTNERGEFFASPIPMGAKCSIRATRGKYIVLGSEFELTAENVLPSFNLDLGETVDAEFRLLDPSGAPLVGQPVTLGCRHPQAKHSWGPPEITNAEGKCRFHGLNPKLEGHYVAELKFTKDYLPATVPLDLSGKATLFRAKQGMVVEGTLLDSQGQPLSGKNVRAHPIDWKLNGKLLYYYEPTAVTDSQGRFRLSNLPSAKMKLQIDLLSINEVVVMPTQSHNATPVTVRALR